MINITGVALPKMAFVPSGDFTTSNTTGADITGLSFPVRANRNYTLTGFLATNSDQSAGIKFAFTGPASPTQVSFFYKGSTSAVGTLTNGQIVALSTLTVAFNQTTVDGVFSIWNGMFSNGANAGTLTLQAAKVTSGNAKVYAGSWLMMMEL